MWLALAVSAIGALFTVAGIYAVRLRGGGVAESRGQMMAFAAGLLIAVSFLHLIPEAFAGGGAAPPGLLAGFLFLLLLSRLAARANGSSADARALGLASLAGIGFHSFVDGVLFSIGFAAGAATGLMIAPGMILHEFVEGILIYRLLIFGGFGERRALWLAIAGAAITTPLGVLLSWPVVADLDPAVTGTLLAAAAGSLLYVAGSHLLPQAGRGGMRDTAALLAGVVVAILILLLKQH